MGIGARDLSMYAQGPLDAVKNKGKVINADAVAAGNRAHENALYSSKSRPLIPIIILIIITVVAFTVVF